MKVQFEGYTMQVRYFLFAVNNEVTLLCYSIPYKYLYCSPESIQEARHCLHGGPTPLSWTSNRRLHMIDT